MAWLAHSNASSAGGLRLLFHYRTPSGMCTKLRTSSVHLMVMSHSDVVLCQKTAKNGNVSWRSKRQLCRGVGHAKRLASDLDNDSVHSGLQVGDSDCPSMSGAHVASRLQKLAQERQTPEARKWKQSITSTSSLNLCQGSHSTSR